MSAPAPLLRAWRRLVAPPAFDNPDDTRWAGMLHAILLTVLAGYGAALLIGVPFLFVNKTAATAAIAVVLAVALAAFAALGKPRTMRLGGAAMCVTLLLVPTVTLLLGRTSNAVVFVAPVMITVVLFGAGWGLVAALAGTAVSTFVIIAPELHMQLPRVFPSPPLAQAFTLLVQLGLAVVPVQIIMRRMGEALRRADAEAAERAAAQALLQRSENRYRAVVDTMAEGMIVRDMNGELLICNAAAERITGFTAAQMGRDSFSLAGWRYVHADGRPFPPEDHPMVSTRRSGEPRSGVVMGFAPPGAAVLTWLSINSVLLRDAGSGEARGVMTTFFDITDRKLTEEALRKSAEKFTKAFRSSPAFIAISSLDEGRYLEVNDAFERVTGYRRDQVVGKTVAEINLWVSPEERLGMVERLRSGQHVERFEAMLRKASGEVMACEIALELIEFDGVQCMIANTVDVTERKRAAEAVLRVNAELEQRVRERTQQLEVLNKDLEAFSATVSHDLRAPVRHISGYLGLLQESIGAGLAADNRKYLDAAGAAAARMGQMISDLLEFSRLGRADIRRRRVDLGALVADVVHSLEPDTRGRDIRWLLRELPQVDADPSLLRQVMVNLLSNALKYTRPTAQPVIEVGVVAAADLPHAPDAATIAGQVVLFVRDNGVGFSMQHAGKLFGVFQRLHSASEFEGSGIGLANVGNIIRRHGGRAWIEGEEGRGATAYVSLPVPAPD